MKKTIILIATITVMVSCNNPNSNHKQPTLVWSSALGEVSFATDSTWTITNGVITQVWSDVVQIDFGKGKTSFDGGNSQTGYKIDFRSNPEQKGCLFSWHAINEYKDELCPPPWRVPTQQDFIDLDIALGGNGNEQINLAHKDRYITLWGGAFGGYCVSDGILFNQNLTAYYWSQSEYTSDFGINLLLDTDGYINPQNYYNRGNGFSLRCVR
jgi:uncharacterized protein (TIGR02145 family)